MPEHEADDESRAPGHHNKRERDDYTNDEDDRVEGR